MKHSHTRCCCTSVSQQAVSRSSLTHFLAKVLYLDIPDLYALARASPSVLAPLVRDRQLHTTRLRVVTPSRVSHALFGLGGSLRPSIPDLVHWGILRGLGIERRWRSGLYFNSREVSACLSLTNDSNHPGCIKSVRQYETSRRLHQAHIRHCIETHLIKHIIPARILKQTEAESQLPSGLSLGAADPDPSTPQRPKDPESRCAPRLLPTIRNLKWSQRRDAFARMVRSNRVGSSIDRGWFEGPGHGIWEESERVRLAICPGVRPILRFWESHTRQN